VKKAPPMEAKLRMVRRLARGMMLRTFGAGFEDLVSAGMLGLAEALRRYKPMQGKPFEAYAQVRIVGAMYDELRGRDLLSRGERRLKQRLSDTERRLTNELGRLPEDSEMAANSKMELPRLQRSIGALYRRIGPLPLQMADQRDVTPELIVAARQEHARLNEHVEALPERLRYVLRCYYVHGRTFRAIGERMHLTESRICQMHAEAVRKLREKYRDAGPLKCTPAAQRVST
jgi:RNA polymerase sigma factor FliA